MASRVYEVQMFSTREKFAVLPVEGSYSFNERAGWLPVQRVCLWLLRKIGCDHFANQIVDVERHLIDPDKFADRFYQADDQIWNVMGRRPKKVYIGADDYAVLMEQEFAPSGPLQFNVKVREGRTYFDVPIEVIPWMKGFLVL